MRSDTSQWLGTPLNPSCERAHLLITRHIDGELAPSDASDLRMHITTCHACRRTLESQAAQSSELAESLRALWNTGLPHKKKFFGVREILISLWRKARQALPHFALCAALVACVLLIATKVNAPSTNGASNPRPQDEPRPQGSGQLAAPTCPQFATPVNPPAQITASKNRNEKQPDTGRTEQPAPADGSAAQNGPADSDDVAIESNGDDEIVVRAVPAESIATKLVVTQPVVTLPVVAPPPPSAPAPRAEQTLAQLVPAPALKPLPGVGMTYSILTESGAREEGRISVLGDVLAGKAVVRLETSAGVVIDAAQSNLDTLAPARRAVARRLLDECLEPGHRKRIEEAVRKLGE